MHGGWAGGPKQEHPQNVVFNQYIDNPLSESFHTWTRGTMNNLLRFHKIDFLGICLDVGLEIKI